MDQEGKRTPSWSIHLMLVGSGQAACAFTIASSYKKEYDGKED
jgi:hypothetical protein